MVYLEPGHVDIDLRESYGRRKAVSEAEWNSIREFEILESSLSRLDAECVRFLKLIIGKFYVLNWKDDYTVTVEDVCRAMRVSPEESIRIMFRSYVQLARVIIAERKKTKGRKYFYVQERFKPLLTQMQVYDKDNPDNVFKEYKEVVNLPISVVRRLVMELTMPASVLCHFDRFISEMLSLLPSVIDRCNTQAKQEKPNADMKEIDVYIERYDTDKQPVFVI